MFRPLLLTGLLVPALHAAAVFEPLEGFALPPLYSQGTLLRAADGNFYGTSALGGAHGRGTVFRMTPAGAVTVLHSFLSGGPEDGLITGPDGSFYGTAPQDGVHGYGCVFRITQEGDFSTLADFSDLGLDGCFPRSALLLGADGNFYGTTTAGGLHQHGTAFQLTPAGALTVFHQFDLSGSDQSGCALVQDDAGDFYGATTGDGSYDFGDEHRGVIFRLTAGGLLTPLHTLEAIGGGPTDATLIRGQDGNFHGTTSNGGTTGYGTVFQLTPAGVFTTRYQFDGIHGSQPAAPLLRAADGTLYGTTSWDTTHLAGTAFKLSPAGALTVLHYFDYRDSPLAGLATGADGALYGTTTQQDSGAAGGAAFKIAPTGRYTPLVDFASLSPAEPLGTLVESRDGNFYGASGRGGTTNGGTLFRITPEQVITPIYSFDQYNSAASPTSLVLGRDGSLYGTTYSDAIYSAGSFFRCSTRGTLKTLYTFDPATCSRPLSLIQGTDGNFYGTADRGTTTRGSVFKLTSRGALTVLADLTTTSGSIPKGELIRSSTGTLYGAAGGNGNHNEGTIFSVPGSGGGATPLLNFGGLVTGSQPSAGLTPGPDGSYYGTTTFGGAYQMGTVFKISAAGAYELIASFPADQGSYPSSKLTLAPDGNFYGTTSGTSIYNQGTVYRVTTGGLITTLASFQGDNGYEPRGNLLLASDGNLYGTTRYGGTTSAGRPAGGGQFYRIRLGAIATPLPADAIAARGATLHGSVETGGYPTTVAFEYSTEPAFRRPVTVKIGTLPGSNDPVPVQAVLTRLLPGRIYYVRLTTRNTENPLPQSGGSISFTTPRR